MSHSWLSRDTHLRTHGVQHDVDEMKLKLAPVIACEVVAEAEAEDSERSVAFVTLPIRNCRAPKVVLKHLHEGH